MVEERQSHRWRWAIAIATVTALALLGLGVAISWHYSSAVLVPDHSDWPQEITVERVIRDRVELSSSEESERPGVFGLTWQGGHAIVGPVLRSDDDSVTRELRDVRGYLRCAVAAAISRKRAPQLVLELVPVAEEFDAH